MTATRPLEDRDAGEEGALLGTERAVTSSGAGGTERVLDGVGVQSGKEGHLALRRPRLPPQPPLPWPQPRAGDAEGELTIM